MVSYLLQSGSYELLANGAYATTSTGGATTTVIEDFEDNDLTNYSGDTGDYNIQSTVAEGGTYALEATTTAQVRDIFTSTDITAPQQGDIFEFWWRPQANTARGGMYFGYDTVADDGYRAFVSQGGGFQIGKYTAGSDSSLAGNPDDAIPTLSNGEWYRIVVEWNNGDSDIVSHIFNADGVELSGSPITASGETDYNHSGIGWHSDDEQSYFDSAVITDDVGGSGETGGGGATGSLIDSFEDEDMSQYTQHIGDAQDYGFTADGATDGNVAVGNVGDSNNVLFEGTGSFPDSFTQNDILRVSVWFGQNAGEVWIHYGMQDSSNYYQIHLDADNNDFDPGVVSGGTRTRPTTSNPTIEAGQYWVQIDWRDTGDHEIKLFDSNPWDTNPTAIQTVTFNDSTYTSGNHGLQWDNTSGNEISIDDLRKI